GRHMKDLVFFDSARETGDPGQISVIAAEPSEMLCGRIDSDFERLRAAVSERQVQVVDRGIPTGFAAGWVEYDGAFRFGMYDPAPVYRHTDDAWFEVGDFRDRMAIDEPKCTPMPRLAFEPSMSREHYCE